MPCSIVSPASGFTNRMIKQGAKLVSGYQEALEELNPRVVAQQLELPLNMGTEGNDEAVLP